MLGGCWEDAVWMLDKCLGQATEPDKHCSGGELVTVMYA